MTDTPEESGVITALLERFNNKRLPRVLDIKKKVDAGEKLSATDLEYLERIFADGAEVQQMMKINPHPEYDELVAQVSHLYKEITTKALENEKNG